MTESVKNNPVEQSESGAGSSLTEEGTGGNVLARLQTPTANESSWDDQVTKQPIRFIEPVINFFSNRPSDITPVGFIEITP
ncbi:hypothetical protein [Rubripirellula reticaptiva]|uniref:hypothetical protein n=1 Tax=Rubripirellula reticaptiva TaxID=2528013 RepID=UPI0011B75D79|nr:hypothetical protein [Rubripirellula reticaptiva]